MKADYTLYLVTDSTRAILGDKDIVSVVKSAVDGGVTIVQYRDKTSDTADLIKTAKRLHEVTKAKGIPLLINDRVDVALAVGCEGVHIGQDDMDISSARKLLGKDKIIGVTASSIAEAEKAARGGADYIGIGTIFATPTKENTKAIIGTAGCREILNALNTLEQKLSAVCIGGINESNVQRVLYQSKGQFKALNGAAVVSAIIAAKDPEKAASKLRVLIATPPAFARHQQLPVAVTDDLLYNEIPQITQRLAETTPLCHNMTNMVVQNFAANVALAIGASPIMSQNGLEAGDLANLGGALVINMGTVTPEGLNNNLMALRAYNAVGGPVLYDPVGAGATEQRRNGVKMLLAGGYFDVIKGNENEIGTVFGMSGIQQRGVDSASSNTSLVDKAKMVKALAARERNVVVMTGKTDLVSDGRKTYAISNGHEYLGEITGSGCTLGTTIAAYLAVNRQDKLMATIAGILHYEIAAEQAALRPEVRGPGTFVPALIDELYAIRQASKWAGPQWILRAKVEEVTAEGSSPITDLT